MTAFSDELRQGSGSCAVTAKPDGSHALILIGEGDVPVSGVLEPHRVGSVVFALAAMSSGSVVASSIPPVILSLPCCNC